MTFDPPGRKIGFSGLKSLGTALPDNLVTEKRVEEFPKPLPPASTDNRPQIKSKPSQQIPQPREQSRSGGVVSKTIIWAVAILGTIWLISHFSSSTSTVPSSWKPTVSSNPFVEEMPPIGTGLTLGYAQIRYCLAEKVRLEGARTSLVQTSNQIARFNALISDWNSRCSDYRYRKGTLESVRTEVDGRRSLLEAEGIARFR
jgi:hypothetical protein